MKYYRTETLEAIARNVLTQYQPNYLNLEPQAVPLERLIDEVFGISIEYMRLTESGNELGRMIFDNGYSTRFDVEADNYELVRVEAGTMLIEARLLEDAKQYGRYRFTLAHELGHWILHKDIFSGTGVAAASYTTDKDGIESVEWQANYLAKAILMPKGQVKRAFYQVQSESVAYTVAVLANLFEVSMQAMKIRLGEIGLISV